MKAVHLFFYQQIFYSKIIILIVNYLLKIYIFKDGLPIKVHTKSRPPLNDLNHMRTIILSKSLRFNKKNKFIYLFG
jgi:hypothetical protein